MAEETAVGRDLLQIARKEAERAQRELQRQVSAMLEEIEQSADPSNPKVHAAVQRLSSLGPDALPLLVETLRSEAPSSRRTRAVHAARAIVAMYERTKDASILDSLDRLLQSSDAAVQQCVLHGLIGFVHPFAGEKARPFLESKDPATVNLAIRVVAAQQDREIAPLLRRFVACQSPLIDVGSIPKDADFQTRNPHFITVLAALEQLGDEATAPLVALVLPELDDSVLTVAIDHLGRFGNRESLPALRALAFGSRELLTTIRVRCLEAVQRIGLRHKNAAGDAHEILLEGFKTDNAKIRDDSAWFLGPYEDKSAYDSLEKSNKERIDRSPRETVPVIELARLQIQFNRWKDAQRTLNKAELLDEKKDYWSEIRILKAVVYCELKNYPKAAESLRSCGRADLRSLLEEWPTLRKMAEDPQYEELFAQ